MTFEEVRVILKYFNVHLRRPGFYFSPYPYCLNNNLDIVFISYPSEKQKYPAVEFFKTREEDGLSITEEDKAADDWEIVEWYDKDYRNKLMNHEKAQVY